MADYFAEKGNIGHLLQYVTGIATPPLDIIDATMDDRIILPPDLIARDLYKPPTKPVRLLGEAMSGLIMEVTLPFSIGAKGENCLVVSLKKKDR